MGDRALVLKNPPTDKDDYTHCSGDGRIEGHVSMAYQGAKLSWEAPSLKPIRRKILGLCAGIFPPFPQLLTPGESPMTDITTIMFPGVPGETNCYAFPGYISRKLGSPATSIMTAMLPDTKNPG